MQWPTPFLAIGMPRACSDRVVALHTYRYPQYRGTSPPPSALTCSAMSATLLCSSISTAAL